MNNQAWYSQVISFCHSSAHCKECPFYLLNDKDEQFIDSVHPCFASKETSCRETEHEDDNQWLKDLLKVQFHEDDDEDDFFSDEEFI